MFFLVSEPKKIMDNSGSNLIYEFWKINETSFEINNKINEINEEKIKIPIDEFGIFSINNSIKYALDKVQEDVWTAVDFS